MSEDRLQALKEQKIWLLYKKIKRNEKYCKMPFATSGKATGTNEVYRHTWVTYADAVEASKKVKCDGIGFVIPEGYFFLDIDHQQLESPWVQEIIKNFSSYTEYSVSGDGIHIYGRCQTDKLPIYFDEKEKKLKLSSEYNMRKSMIGMELYFGGLTNRYAVFTGNEIGNNMLNDCTEAIQETLDKYMKRTEAHVIKDKITDNGENKMERKNTDNKNAGRDLEKEALNLIMQLGGQKNREKFFRLFHDGEWEADYGSQSEADLALCAMIGFKTDDMELMDAVFRKSSLYRADKWEEETYRKNTMEKAISMSRENGRKKEKKRPSYILVDEDGKESLSVTLLASYIRNNWNYILVKDDACEATMKYVYEKGCYRLYDEGMMCGVIRKEIGSYNDSFARMGAVKEAYQNIMAEDAFVKRETLNAEEGIINFQNGILRVTDSNLEMEEHSPDIYSTIQIPCAWVGEETPTPVFDNYMNALTNGNKEIEQLLLQFMGVCLSNIKGWRMKKALFMVGEGNTGKSQLKSLVERILGGANCIGIDLQEIEKRFGTGAVYGKRLSGSSDMSFLSIGELKTFKKMTGGDSIFAEYKNQQGFHYTYNGVLWFCMNRLPKFGGDDGKWVYDRIMVVDCNNVIPEEKQDKELLDKMYAEREGIVYKAVKALQTVIAKGYRYSEPKSVLDAREDYHKENSTVISFFEECMRNRGETEQIDKKCTTGRIYDIYKKWCDDNNNGFQKSAKEFREDLSRYLGKTFQDITKRMNGNTYYSDYVLTHEAKTQYGGSFYW